ncbi:hypothetical protein HBB16_05115 [Pseudonocardia sp. MCCB 268]|nr:hypothetical protein [Pseudonocardia cytotoxica]
MQACATLGYPEERTRTPAAPGRRARPDQRRRRAPGERGGLPTRSPPWGAPEWQEALTVRRPARRHAAVRQAGCTACGPGTPSCIAGEVVVRAGAAGTPALCSAPIGLEDAARRGRPAAASSCPGSGGAGRSTRRCLLPAAASAPTCTRRRRRAGRAEPRPGPTRPVTWRSCCSRTRSPWRPAHLMCAVRARTAAGCSRSPSRTRPTRRGWTSATRAPLGPALDAGRGAGRRRSCGCRVGPGRPDDGGPAGWGARQRHLGWTRSISRLTTSVHRPAAPQRGPPTPSSGRTCGCIGLDGLRVADTSIPAVGASALGRRPPPS